MVISRGLLTVVNDHYWPVFKMRLYVKKICYLPVPLLVLAILVTLFLNILFQTSGSKDLERLLAGYKDVEINSFTIFAADEKLTINDVETLRYLSDCFRGALEEGYIPRHRIGYIHAADIQFANGGSVMTEFNVHPSADGLTIGHAAGFDDPVQYWVELPQPMPATMSVFIARMREPPSHKVGK